MKLKVYIPVLVMCLAMVFTACEDDKYVEPVVSPAVQMEHIQTATANEITVKILPSKSVVKFNYAIGQDEDREAFLAGTLDDITTVEGSEEISALFTGLREVEVYTVFARGFAADGTAGPLAMIKVKTRAKLAGVTAVPLFEAEKSAAVTIRGNTSWYKYVFALGRPGDRETFDKGVLDGTSEVKEMSEYTATYFDLDINSEYVFYITAYDRLSGQPAETMEVPVKTAAKGTVPAVDVILEHIDIFSGDFRIVPNALCGKFGVAATLEGGYDEAIGNEIYKGSVLGLLRAWERSNNGYVTIGYQQFPYQFNTASLMLGSDDAFNRTVELFVMVYGEGPDPVNVQRFTFETPPYDDGMGEADVTIQVTDIHDNGAMYEFEVNEYTMGLVYETVDEEWYESLLQSGQYYEGYLEDLIFETGYWNYTHGITRTSFPEGTAQPGRTYRVFYMAMNYNGPFGGLSRMKSYSYTTTGERKN